MREQFSKKDADEKPPVSEGTDVKVKLPMLTITKFKGTLLDWMRFLEPIYRRKRLYKDCWGF